MLIKIFIMNSVNKYCILTDFYFYYGQFVYFLIQI